MALGPVLHPDDAVASKMAALHARAQARDFIDVGAAIQSGRYGREIVLQLAARADSGFGRRIFAGALARAELLDAADFGQYGITGRELVSLRARFAAWRAELLAGESP